MGDGAAGSLIGSGKPANSGCDSANLIVNDCWHLAHLARFPSFSLASLNGAQPLRHEIDSFILQVHGVNIDGLGVQIDRNRGVRSKYLL